MLDAILGGLGMAANIAGDIQANAQNVRSAHEATEANKQMAQDQMAFQERMANSAYQRATEDMRKAGINPMLAYMKGGADTPNGASGSAVSPQIKSITASGVSSAMDTMRLHRENLATDSAIALNAASAEAKQTESLLNRTNSANAEIRNERDRIENELLKQSVNSRVKGIAADEVENDLRRTRGEFDKKTQQFDQIVDRVRSTTGAAGSALDLFRKGPKIQLGPDYSTPSKRELKLGKELYYKNLKNRK